MRSTYLLPLIFVVGLVLASWSGGGDDDDFPPLTPFAPELAAKIAQIKVKVSEIRGLPVPVLDEEGVVTMNSLQQYSLDQYKGLSSDDAEDVKTFERVAHMLALIPDDYSFENYRNESTGDIAGLYFIQANRLVLIGDATRALSKTDEIVIAHEITHAMQDATFDLDKFSKTWADSQLDKDGYTSYRETTRCLIEGDATFTEFKYAEAVLGPDWIEQIQAESPENKTGSSLPSFLREEQLFDYRECRSFVEQLYEKGGWDAVNAAYTKPPATTEQVIDVRKYERDEIANGGKPSDLTTLLNGWKEGKGGQFGAYDLYAFLSAFSDQPFTPALAAGGWGAGWATEYTDPADSNHSVVQLYLSFDSQQDLQEFLLVYGNVIDDYGVEISSLKPGAVVRWSTARQYGPFGAITIDKRLPSVEIHIASDEASLVAAMSGLS